MLQLLQKLEAVIGASPIDQVVTREDFKEHWRQAHEETLYFILRIHFGHYKSAAESEFLSKIHALFGHIATNTNHPLPRWY